MAVLGPRRFSDYTEVAPGAVTDGLFFIGYDPLAGEGVPAGVRVTAAAIAAYTGTGGGGGTPADSITLRCADDLTLHTLTTKKVTNDDGSTEYVLNLALGGSGTVYDSISMACAEDLSSHTMTVNLVAGEYVLNLTQ